MTNRRLSAFIDALAAGRRPKRFQAEPEDVDVLRTAIALRTARPGESAPSETFVSGLFQKLSDQASAGAADEVRPVATRPRRTALVAVAAAVVLVGGTAVATENLAQNGPSLTAQPPHGTALRTGSFQTADSKVFGQIVAYHGHPSWVFMNVDVPNYNGRLVCKLQVDDGSTVAFGAFTLHRGIGQFSRTLEGVNVAQLRGAKLVTPTGSVVASATFAS
jgi:hypothetical protein